MNGADLLVPHMQIGAERVRQHQHRRALRPFDLGMDGAAVIDLDVGHCYFLPDVARTFNRPRAPRQPLAATIEKWPFQPPRKAVSDWFGEPPRSDAHGDDDEWRISASGRRQQTVWEKLNDPAVLKACIPGCESARQDLGHRIPGGRHHQDRPGQGQVQRQGHAVRSRPAERLQDLRPGRRRRCRFCQGRRDGKACAEGRRHGTELYG